MSNRGIGVSVAHLLPIGELLQLFYLCRVKKVGFNGCGSVVLYIRDRISVEYSKHVKGYIV